MFSKNNSVIFDAFTATNSNGIGRRFYSADVSSGIDIGREYTGTGIRSNIGAYICTIDGQIFKII